MERPHVQKEIGQLPVRHANAQRRTSVDYKPNQALLVPGDANGCPRMPLQVTEDSLIAKLAVSHQAHTAACRSLKPFVFTRARPFREARDAMLELYRVAYEEALN